MANNITITASVRDAGAGHVRTQGNIPAILYGHGITNEVLQVEARQFAKVFAQAGYTSLVTMRVGEQDHSVLIRDVQLHPLKSHVTHVDFYQVRLDEKVRAEVPLNFVGESPAIKDLSGVLVRSVDTVEVEAFPQDLPRDIAVDISVLKNFDSAIHIKDITLPAGVEIFNEPEEVVALVQAPRTEQELEALSEEATEDVESVEGIKKEETVPEDEAKDAEKKSKE